MSVRPRQPTSAMRNGRRYGRESKGGLVSNTDRKLAGVATLAPPDLR